MGKCRSIVDPRVVCRNAGISNYCVDETAGVVYVNDIQKLTEYLGVNLPVGATGIERHGWLWVQSKKE